MNETEYTMARIVSDLAAEMPKTRCVKVVMGVHLGSAVLGSFFLLFGAFASLASSTATGTDKGEAVVVCFFLAVVYGLWAWFCWVCYESINALRDRCRTLMTERAAKQLTANATANAGK